MFVVFRDAPFPLQCKMAEAHAEAEAEVEQKADDQADEHHEAVLRLERVTRKVFERHQEKFVESAFGLQIELFSRTSTHAVHILLEMLRENVPFGVTKRTICNSRDVIKFELQLISLLKEAQFKFDDASAPDMDEKPVMNSCSTGISLTENNQNGKTD